MAVSFPSGSVRIANVRRSSSKKRRHQHLLDTGVRNSEADRQRKRWWFGIAAKFFIAAVVVAGAYVGISKLVARTIMKNPQYNISELSVETDGILTSEEILATADLHRGTNIFHVDLAQAQARVAAIPQVEKVFVSRQLPNRVAIQVNERRPVAWIAPAGGAASRDEVIASKSAWLIDANGILLRLKKLNTQDRFLPIVRNYTDSAPLEGKEAVGEEIKATLDLFRAQQESSNTARFQIEEVDLAKHFGLMVTDRNGMQVLFGLDEMDRQLKRLDVYLQAMDQHAQKPQTINLLVQRNVPVTFLVAAATTDRPVLAPTTAASPAAINVAPVKNKEKTKSREKSRASEKSKEKAHPKSKTSESNHSKPTRSHEQPFLDRTSNAPRALPVNVGH